MSTVRGTTQRVLVCMTALLGLSISYQTVLFMGWREVGGAPSPTSVSPVIVLPQLASAGGIALDAVVLVSLHAFVETKVRAATGGSANGKASGNVSSARGGGGGGGGGNQIVGSPVKQDKTLASSTQVL